MYVFVCIPRSLSVSRELTVPCQYTKFQNPSGKVNMEEKHSETCMHTSFFKREPRTDTRSLSVSRELTVPCQYTEFQKQSVKINMEEK